MEVFHFKLIQGRKANRISGSGIGERALPQIEEAKGQERNRWLEVSGELMQKQQSKGMSRLVLLARLSLVGNLLRWIFQRKTLTLLGKGSFQSLVHKDLFILEAFRGRRHSGGLSVIIL